MTSTNLQAYAAALTPLVSQIQQLLTVATISKGNDTRQLERQLEACADELERALYFIQTKGNRYGV